jgi:hypothetical protein
MTPARRSRQWTRVEPPSERNGTSVEPRAVGDHRFAIYDARLVRCSCGAMMLATDPVALQQPVDTCDDDAIALHAAWCAELLLTDFGEQQPTANGVEPVER